MGIEAIKGAGMSFQASASAPDVKAREHILEVHARKKKLSDDVDLGTIAKSGSLAFKEANEKKEDIDIIGQFGVGFYSAFMISKLVTVESKKPGEEKSYRWVSSGDDGYSIEQKLY